VLDKVAAKGNRSALIDRAIKRYVKTQGQQNLHERLKQEALANAERSSNGSRVVSFGRGSMSHL